MKVVVIKMRGAPAQDLNRPLTCNGLGLEERDLGSLEQAWACKWACRRDGLRSEKLLAAAHASSANKDNPRDGSNGFPDSDATL